MIQLKINNMYHILCTDQLYRLGDPQRIADLWHWWPVDHTLQASSNCGLLPGDLWYRIQVCAG